MVDHYRHRGGSSDYRAVPRFFVNWGLAALSVIILVPGAISLAILAKHPESTSGRSMFGISNPDALLDPIRRPSERRGK